MANGHGRGGKYAVYAGDGSDHPDSAAHPTCLPHVPASLSGNDGRVPVPHLLRTRDVHKSMNHPAARNQEGL